MKKDKDESVFYYVFYRDNSLDDNIWYFVDFFNTREEAEEEMEITELETEVEHKVIKGTELQVKMGCNVTKFNIMENEDEK